MEMKKLRKKKVKVMYKLIERDIEIQKQMQFNSIQKCRIL